MSADTRDADADAFPPVPADPEAALEPVQLAKDVTLDDILLAAEDARTIFAICQLLRADRRPVKHALNNLGLKMRHDSRLVPQPTRRERIATLRQEAGLDD